LKKTGNDMNLKRILFIALVLQIILPAAGFCFDATAFVDKNRISRDDSIFLKVETEGGVADLDLSSITDFKVMSRGSSSSFKSINGKIERKAIYQFLLIPLKKGSLTIPPIKAKRNGQTALTQKVVIHVTDHVVRPDDVKELFATSGVSKPGTSP